MKITFRARIFLTTFAIGIIPTLAFVGINLSDQIRRQDEVEYHHAEIRQRLELATLNAEISHYRQTLEAVMLLPEIKEIVRAKSRVSPSPELIGLLSSWFSPRDAIISIALYDQDDQEKICLTRNDNSFQLKIDGGASKYDHNRVSASRELILSTTTGKGGNTITASFRIDTRILLADHLNSLWINPVGTYLHQPYTIKLTIAPSTNALEDFPKLQSLLSTRKASLWKSASGYTVSWLPLILDGMRPAMWIGIETDRTENLKWQKSLLRNIIITTMTITVLVAFAANTVAKWISSSKKPF